MIGAQFGPDISYQKSKEVKVSPSREPASKKSTRERVIAYFRKQGKLAKYKKQGILEEKISLGVALEEGNKDKAAKIRKTIKAMTSRKQSPGNKSQMSPLDIPKYVRRPGTVTKNVGDPHLSVPTDTSLHKDIEDIARSTGLNLVITSGHRGKDNPSYREGSAHSEVGGAYDISLMEKGKQRSLTDKERNYVAKALRERGRRVLQEYGSLYRQGKGKKNKGGGKTPHLHTSTRGQKRSGFYSPFKKKVYPTELSNVQLEEDLTKKFLQKKKDAPVKQAMDNKVKKYTDQERREFTLNLADQGLTPTVEK